MNRHIYGKLAITNLKKNQKIYLPYLLTLMGSMLLYYILTSISTNKLLYDPATDTGAFKGANILSTIIQSGSMAAALFAFIFLLYANSFVLKHQKKQLGLYRVLGMERKHMIRIIFVEILTLFGISMVISLFFGILFDKLMLGLLFKIVHQSMPEGFFLNTTALLQTLFLSFALAVLIFIRSVFSIFRTKDIDLLKSEKQGEREPKNRLLLAFFGLASLLAGYYIALSNKNVMQAINNFFPAAFCVILGTYALFTAGSIAILKLLKKNKAYYYNTKHFISLSGMLYRMKQNAVGLATICILSAAAIVVVSAGVSLYANGQRSINQQFPRSMQVYTDYTSQCSDLQKIIEDTAKKSEISYKNPVNCSYGNGVYDLKGNQLVFMKELLFDVQKTPDTYVVTLEEYNRFQQSSVKLEEDEILLYGGDNIFPYDTLVVNEHTYRIKEEADNTCLTYITDVSMSLFSKLFIVVPNQTAFDEIMPKDYEFSQRISYLGFDSNGNDEKQKDFSKKLTKAFKKENISFDIVMKSDGESFFYTTYGGLFFVGILLGFLFLLCTVMIIYYKQISEGYEDRERFLIMQKVGLSKKEIKQSIHSQVMMLFFLPLITAIVHSAVALNIVADCLRMVMVVDMPTFVGSVAVTCVLFSIVYGIIYKITSKEYYTIVNE